MLLFIRLFGRFSVVAVLGYAVLQTWPVGQAVGLPAALKGDVEKGAYVAHMAGCLACHTNHKEEGAPFSGGAALKTVFGTFFGPNITPDPVHGIGGWSRDDFATALRQGVSPEGRPYYPAFPYTYYTKMRDQDVADLWAFLKAVEPVSVPGPHNDLKFPFTQIGGVKLWRALYFDDAPLPEEMDRGAYIVEGPAHCGACHTPRTLLGGPDQDRKLQGSTGLPNNGKAPNITAAALAAEGYDQDGLVFALQLGMMPSGDFFGGSMAEVVEHGTSKLSPEDLQAVATYLLSLD